MSIRTTCFLLLAVMSICGGCANITTPTGGKKDKSPPKLVSIDPSVTGLNKHVVVKIVDSLLDSNTTYRISFGNAIKDLHEGNPFSKYTYTSPSPRDRQKS